MPEPIERTLPQEIADAIKKQLPQHVGEAIQAELADLAKLRLLNKSQADMIVTLRADKGALEAKASGLEAKALEHAAIDQRVAAVRERELKQDLRDLEVKSAHMRHADAFEMVRMVFRSPVYVEHVQGTIPIPVEGAGASQYGSGSAGFVSTGTIDKLTKRSVE